MRNSLSDKENFSNVFTFKLTLFNFPVGGSQKYEHRRHTRVCLGCHSDPLFLLHLNFDIIYDM